MISIEQKIRLAWKTYEKGFAEGLEEETFIWRDIAQETTLASGHTKEFPMSFTHTEWREWAGERQSGIMQTKVYSFGVKEYESFVKVPATAFEDDVFDQDMWVDQFRDMGNGAARLPENLVIAAYQNGDAAGSICVDDLPYFSTSHPDNYFAPVTPWSNLYTSWDLTQTNFEIAYDLMRKRRTWMGIAMNIRPDTLLVPPSLERRAMKILEHAEIPFVSTNTDGSSISATMVPNDNYKKCRIVVSQDLDNQPNTWYLLSTRGRKKPVTLMWRKKPVLKKSTPTAASEDHIREVEYVGTSRAGVGFGWPHFATKCVGG